MPTYEYRCPKGHLFEKFFPSIRAKKTEPCPVCGKLAVRLISGGAGLVFKGSGFYITDYKRAGEKKPEGEATPKADTKPDTKPAEAKPSKQDPKDK